MNIPIRSSRFLNLSQLPKFFTNCCYKCTYNRTSFFCRVDLRYPRLKASDTMDCELWQQFIIDPPFPKYECPSYHPSKEYLYYLQTHIETTQINQIYL